ncbi:MAG: murein biosynthesis integral membrane protein MurJ, partial [Burkholderiales bacterium]|nr:murein biosynthesis integral membrane protein MurJ [Burkholderiales bacterium]
TPAFTPVLLNIAVICAAIFLAPHFNPPIYALTIGVIVGGLLQLGWQIPALMKIGMLPRISFHLMTALRDPQVRKILKLMLPATLAVSVAQISLIINTNWAASLGNGAVSWISYADRLMEFPTGMLGVALGTILLPSLTRAHASGDMHEYKKLLHWGLRLTLLLALPAAVGLGVLAVPLTSTLFQHGRFNAVDVQKTAQALTMYSFGLLGLISVKILASAYYAKQDILTPVLIGIGVLIATQLMNVLFVPYLQHAGLSLSIGLGACLNALILVFLLSRRGMLGDISDWLGFIAKISLAVFVMAVVAYFSSHQVNWLSMNHGFTAMLQRALWLVAVICVSAVAYFAVLFAAGFRMSDFRLVSHA